MATLSGKQFFGGDKGVVIQSALEANKPIQQPVQNGQLAPPDNFMHPLDALSNQYKSAINTAAEGVASGSQTMSRGGVGNFLHGATQAGLGAASAGVGAIFAPFSASADAMVPEGKSTVGKFASDAAKGAVIGGELGSIIPGAGTLAGGAVGALFGGGMHVINSIKDAIFAHTSISEADKAMVNNALNVGLAVLGEKTGEAKTKPGEGLNTPVSEIPGAVKKNVSQARQQMLAPVTSAYDAVRGKASGIVDNTKMALSRGNVPESFAASVDRINADALGGGGSQRNPAMGRNNALKLYDDFYAQEQKFKGDITQDTAIGQVGSTIGKNYEQVAQMRRDAGKVMEAEIGKIGNITTDISKPAVELGTELERNGLKYDAKSKTWEPTKTSKVTSQDAELLNQYQSEFNKLGANPTIAELDAFLSRTPKELDVYKGKHNITSVTNGERIVKAHLDSLRDALDPKVDPRFKTYAEAKNDYSALSRFLDEGSTFLGKKTASGDYRMDASVAKSAVQSILNGGKKDWLLKLQKLTGYGAVDAAMLAIQAMKDSGNFRGSSLLDLLTPKEKGGSSLPTSAKGAIQKGAEALIEKGKESFVGSANEQTRRFILDRIQQGNATIPSQMNPEEIPKGNGPARPKTTLKNPEIGNIDIIEGIPTKGRKSGYGMAKIRGDHPEVLPYLDEAVLKAKTTQKIPGMTILQTEPIFSHQGTKKAIRILVDHQLGTGDEIVQKTFLNNAYFIR